MNEPKTIDYEITNVEGVERATLHLVCGVNILRGRNAAGKSSALRAVSRVSGGKTPIERRDGSEHGSVSGPGVTLRVGKVVRPTGEAEVELADVGPLARLIDPQLKSSEAAARERIRALTELLGLPPDDETLAKLCQGHEELLGVVRRELRLEAIDELLPAAERVRHQAHAMARAAEQDRDRAAAEQRTAAERCAALLRDLGGPERLVGDDPERARLALDEATRKHERAVAQCEAREELERRQERIRETLGKRPDTSAAQQLAEQRATEERAAFERVRSLERELERARSELERASERSEMAARDHADALNAEEHWLEQQRILEQPVEGPDRKEVARLKVELVDEAARLLERARLSAEYRGAEEAKVAAERWRDATDRTAKELRDLAAEIPAKLGEILAEAGAPGLTVIDGRLHALQEGGQPLDFETRLSDGQRVRAALEVAAQAYGEKVVPLSGPYWQALDPRNRREFARLAQERGLYVLTEEPAEGDLRVEHE